MEDNSFAQRGQRDEEKGKARERERRRRRGKKVYIRIRVWSKFFQRNESLDSKAMLIVRALWRKRVALKVRRQFPLVYGVFSSALYGPFHRPYIAAPPRLRLRRKPGNTVESFCPVFSSNIVAFQPSFQTYNTAFSFNPLIFLYVFRLRKRRKVRSISVFDLSLWLFD